MQVNNSYIINSQTVQPYTKTQRMFNMKETNSTGGCIGSNCGPNLIQNAALSFNDSADLDPNVTKVPVVSSDGSVSLQPTQPTGQSEQSGQGKDFVYNSAADWRAPTYNQWTRIHDDNCNEQNRLNIASKPMKYFVNQFNSPQIAPFMQFTVVGGQKTFDVRNDYERAIPTRLNPIYPVNVRPYQTTPFLGQASEDRMYTDTSSQLRFGNDLRSLKSQTGNTEVDFNRWAPNVSPETAQNAGQFNGKLQQAGPDGYYNYTEQNNTLWLNSATPPGGISSRNLLHNIVEMSGC